MGDTEAANIILFEYHQDVFLGELEPQVWRSEWEGTLETPKTKEELDDAEEAWLIEHAGTLAKRVRGRRAHDIRTMLGDSLDQRGTQCTKLVIGAAWENQTVAGPDGCRVISWPLA